MSTQDSNVHPDYNPNLKIKDEPDSVSESSVSAVSSNNLIKVIKTEPGIPASTNVTTRLASFRVPRDLTLGGNIKLERPKKVYTPNLNAQRIKNREEQNAVKNESIPKTNKGRNRDKGKGDKDRDRGKGRSKTSNLVQESGIFSEGIANISTKRHSSGGYRDRESSGGGQETVATLERPKLSIPEKVNKAKEAEKLRELLRDDFMDDGADIDLENFPVALPLIEEGKLFKSGFIKKNQTSNDKEKYSPNLQNGEAEGKIKLISPQLKIKTEKLPLNVSQVVENISSSFLLMQLPDCLPGLQADDKHTDPKTKKLSELNTDETDQLNKFCILNNLKEGMLGKIQILRSGKARLMLGDNNLIVDVGSNLSFRQDLIAVKINDDRHNGNLVNLGPVNNTLICSPDWENLLKKL